MLLLLDTLPPRQGATLQSGRLLLDALETLGCLPWFVTDLKGLRFVIRALCWSEKSTVLQQICSQLCIGLVCPAVICASARTGARNGSLARVIAARWSRSET